MSSLLVIRYAELSKRPLEEVEGIWRTAKKRANESGKKAHWPTVLAFFKESLNLGESDGRLVFFHEAPSEILAETPAFALIRILDAATVDESIKELVERSQGLIAVNYEHLFNQPNQAPIGYPYQRGSIEETTTSIGLGGTPTVKMGSGYMFVPGLTVRHRGRSAMVCYSGPKETKIQYLNDTGMLMGEEAMVNNNELSVKRSGIYEEAESIWLGMDRKLTEDQRKVGLREILKMEHRLDHVPESLIEAVVKSFSINGKTRTPSKLQLTNEDWEIVFNKDQDSDEKKADDKAPLPDKPIDEKPPTAKPEASAPTKPGTSTTKSNSDREPSDAEIKGMIAKVKEDRPSINLKLLADSAERDAAAKIMGNKLHMAESKEARLAKRAAQWDNILGNT